jgi:GNAT superfamily N-acetyltransferase
VAGELERFLENDSHSIYVGIDSGNVIVGYSAVHWLPYLFLPSPEGLVSELFIADPARGRGMGPLLLKAVEAKARSLGCSRLHLINFRNRELYRRSFYEKAGWIERPEGASFVRYLDE